MEKPEQRQHDQILGILLILYGCFQLFGTIFIGVIMWAATGGHFYYQVLKTPRLLVSFGILLLILVLPFLCGLMCYRRRRIYERLQLTVRLLT
jgi:hypothetical protein